MYLFLQGLVGLTHDQQYAKGEGVSVIVYGLPTGTCRTCALGLRARARFNSDRLSTIYTIATLRVLIIINAVKGNY
jgi:hypothetical protein